MPVLLRQATPSARARLMTALQRSVGNATARQLLTEPLRSAPTVHGGGPRVSLHGDTTANYDGRQVALGTEVDEARAAALNAPPMIRAFTQSVPSP